EPTTNERGPTCESWPSSLLTPLARRPGLPGQASASELTATASLFDGLFVIPGAAHELGGARRIGCLRGPRIAASAAEARATAGREWQDLGRVPIRTFHHGCLHRLMWPRAFEHGSQIRSRSLRVARATAQESRDVTIISAVAGLLRRAPVELPHRSNRSVPRRDAGFDARNPAHFLVCD